MPPNLLIKIKPITLAGLILIAFAATTCAPASRYQKRPAPRFGSLPFPGPFTLFALADPDDLGRHQYSTALRPLSADPPVERGTLYTQRAGFLDISHIRKAADWTKHFAVKVAAALHQQETDLVLKGEEPSKYHISFNYPAFWPDLAPHHLLLTINELAIRIGQRLSYLMNSWHEIVTWFGYKSTIVIPESPSAFVYDDTISHAVGVIVAGQAIRNDPDDYERAFTAELTKELRRLRVVPKDDAMLAIKKVQGQWWQAGAAKKWYLELGLENTHFEPWIVLGLPDTHGIRPESFTLPNLENVHGRDFSNFYRVEIAPVILEATKMRAVLPSRPKRFTVDEHLPTILAHIRTQKYLKLGPHTLEPY